MNTSKRRNDRDGDGASKRAKKYADYKGYTFAESDDDDKKCPPELDRVAIQTDSKEFFEKYIATRKPCILSGSSTLMDFTSIWKELQAPLGETNVQVERRQSEVEPFGQVSAQHRERMKLSDFLAKLKSDDEQQFYYLSTQQQQSETTADLLPPPFFGPPCEQLSQSGGCLVPRHVDLAGNLVLQSCNMWLGAASSSSSSSSSGLHHDFHDNFYLVLSGRKQYRLFCPTDAPFLAVSGDIERIHNNGLISYTDHPTRADGVPVVVDTANEADSASCKADGVIFGRGFDYESSADEAADSDEQSADIFDEFDGGDDTEDVSEAATKEEDEDDLPNHFCWIDPTVPREKILQSFPTFAKAGECIVELQAGDALYLPAGWFHCVTSSSGREESSPVHMAINYWYHPPDNLADYEHPYRDLDLWSKASKKKKN